MAVAKSLEHWAKLALAAVLAFIWFRPWRRSRLASLSGAKRVLLVRIDQRVGEVLLTTPVINRLVSRGVEVQVLVHPKMLRVIDGLPGVARVWPFEKSLASVRALRAQRFDAVVNCGNWATPAVTSAITARLIAGTGVAVGPATAPTGWLMDTAVEPVPNVKSEVIQRAHLVDGIGGEAAGEGLHMSFRTPRPSDEVRAFIASVSAQNGPTSRTEQIASEHPGSLVEADGSTLSGGSAPRFGVVNPGGRLGERRVPASAFAAGCRAMVDAEITPVVTWGPGEEALADEVCALCPQAVRAVATDLDGLAALCQAAVMTLCNNTGPMHLAVAVGSPTLALFSRIDMARWSHPHAPNRCIDVTALLGDAAALEALVAREVREITKR